MKISVQPDAWHTVDSDWLAVIVPADFKLSGRLGDLNDALDGQIERLRETGDFTGQGGELCAIPDVPGIEVKRLMLVGCGATNELDVASFRRAVATAARKAAEREDTSLAIASAATESSSLSSPTAVQATAVASVVATAGQGLYQAEASRYPFREVVILADASKENTAAAERGRHIGDAVNLTRELVNLCADDIYPESFAARAKKVAEATGLDCQVLDENQLAVEKMGSMLAVARGSDRPPRLVVLEHKGGKANQPTLALVGKGVTFDSGGLSLKNTEQMSTMKADMAGAATVLGAMQAIARLKLPVNVVGFMGMVENMVSGNSYKLGDVLRARNGVTIEVLNTDAEGRLVLADVLHYASERADRMIDLATLTGSVMVALGENVCGAFSNDDGWCAEIVTAAKRSGEGIWQMPMFDEYADQLKSDVADCKNIGTRWGGSITAAKFLEKFVDETPWVHLDIAGAAFASSSQPHREGGATGAMLATLVATATALANK